MPAQNPIARRPLVITDHAVAIVTGIALVGLIAGGSPSNAPPSGSNLPVICVSSASDSISIDGPCCQSDRLAVDHADVPNANIKATPTAPAIPSPSIVAIVKMTIVVIDTIADARTSSMSECRRTIGSPGIGVQRDVS